MTLEEALAELANERASRLRAEAELNRANAIIRRARDASPVQRPSLKRVLQLVGDACMTLERIKGGWLLKLGRSLSRRFRKLSQIWELLIQDDWSLSELFTEPPKTRSRPPLPPPKLMPRNPSIVPATAESQIPFFDSDQGDRYGHGYGYG